MTKVRTRFAPSPTGYLHAGGARTALFNYLFARHSGGEFVLRIEDTDRERSSEEFERAIMEDLRWLGMEWDEGPGGVGLGPYRQSERAHIYKKEADRLLDDGRAYRCYCTVERLKELKAAQVKEGEPSRYDGRCRGLDGPTAGADPGASVLRFIVKEGAVAFDDGVHGQVSVEPSRAGGDFIIIGSDGLPTYNFAAAVDDALMEITHVMRGDDHLANTPRQILLTKALGYDVPHFVHLPLVLAEDGKPLSKRHMGASVAELREAGYLPVAVVNSLARLGWAPADKSFGDRLFSRTTLASKFELKGLSKSPSIFDIGRLRSFNKEELSKGNIDDLRILASNLSSRFGKMDDEWFLKAATAVMGSISILKEAEVLVEPFVEDIEPTNKAAEILKQGSSKDILKTLVKEVSKITELTVVTVDSVMCELKKTGIKGKALFMPIRAALTGRTEGIELDKTLTLLGKEKVLERLDKYTKET